MQHFQYVPWKGHQYPSGADPGCCKGVGGCSRELGAHASGDWRSWQCDCTIAPSGSVPGTFIAIL